MGLSCYVRMGSVAVSTLVSSHILQITQKSEHTFPLNGELLTMAICRVILSGIRNMGRCPCPRCLIPRERADRLGEPLDIRQRSTLRRIESVKRRTWIETARTHIYKHNRTVTSKKVEDLLQEESLVPTNVRCLP